MIRTCFYIGVTVTSHTCCIVKMVASVTLQVGQQQGEILSHFSEMRVLSCSTVTTVASPVIAGA